MKCKIVLLIIATVLAISCKQSSSSKESLRVVKCSEVVMADNYNTATQFPGKVVAACDVNLSFRVAGVIDRVPVKEGDYIAKGEVVALMDKRDYELQLEATQAEYDAIKGEVERVLELYKKESVTDNDYEKAVSGLKRITAKLESHKNALKDTELRAPFSGRVQKVMFNRGEAVSAGMPIVSFISTDSPEVIINLPAANYIKRNDILSAEAKIDLFPGMSFPLTLIGTAPKANLNQLHATHFLIKAVGDTIPTPGMSVIATLEYKSDYADMMCVPFSAVVESNGTVYVWIIKEGKATKRVVSVKEVKSNGTAFIVGDVVAGDSIVVAGVNSIKEGQQLSVMPIK